MLSKETEIFLDAAVKKSLGYNPEESAKWSIVECWDNEYLRPDYDPFEMLEFELMTITLRNLHFGNLSETPNTD